MGLRRDLTAGSRIELCRELRLPPIDPITLGPERLLRGLFILSQLQGARKFRRTAAGSRRSAGRRHQPPRPSLPLNVKDFQFRHEDFHLFQSDEALPAVKIWSAAFKCRNQVLESAFVTKSEQELLTRKPHRRRLASEESTGSMPCAPKAVQFWTDRVNYRGYRFGKSKYNISPRGGKKCKHA